MAANLISMGLDFLLGRKAASVSLHVLADHPILGQPKYLNRLSHHGKHRPVMLICETVNICNNDCVICPYGVMERKKSIMTMELFRKVVKEYAELGGGTLSLTPMVGEIFLDKLLPDRLRTIAEFPSITRISATTNATHADHFAGERLEAIMNSLTKLHISIYGLDREEHLAFTKRDDHDRVLESIRTIIRASRNPGQIAFGFRTLRKYDDSTVKAWIVSNFGREFTISSNVHSYANWGGTTDTSLPLPQDATWMPVPRNTEQCLIPMIAFQIFVNGDVSYCCCCDYDATPEFHLGNITETPLADIFNSERVRELWKASLPKYCQSCTFHMPLRTLPENESILDDPLPLIGG